MIDLHGVWLPQILSYARLLAAPEVLQRAWMEGDKTQTSVTDPSELFEQIFDDLDSEAMLKKARIEIHDQELLDRLNCFLECLIAIDRRHDEGASAAMILSSDAWSIAVRAAIALLSHAKQS